LAILRGSGAQVVPVLIGGTLKITIGVVHQ